MSRVDLRVILEEIGLSQANFARLLQVTPRTVNLWLGGDRDIPGPVEAYVRLFKSLTASQRQTELARLKQKESAMRDGMYGVSYSSVAGEGYCVLVFDEGRVFGVDPWGAKYDGEYVYDSQTGMAEFGVKVTFPAHCQSVLGISHPYEWSLDLKTALNPRQDSGVLRISTPVGRNIDAQYRYLRPLPYN
jgi:hypothetical protein